MGWTLQVPWLSSLLAFMAEKTLGRTTILALLYLKLVASRGLKTTLLWEQSVLSWLAYSQSMPKIHHSFGCLILIKLHLKHALLFLIDILLSFLSTR